MESTALIFVTAGLAVVFALLVLAWFAVRRLPPRSEGPLTLEWAELDGWRIRYHRSGQGPYLILLHGIGANLYCWRTLIPRLNRHFSVIALDLPGFGQSSHHADAGYGLDEQTDRLRSFLRRLGVRRASLVGNSMGGNIALWYGLRFPGEVDRLVVIAPAASPGLVPIAAKSLAWLAGPAARLTSRAAMTWAHRRTVSRKHLVDRERVEETFKTYGRNPAAVRSFLLATEAIRDARLGERLEKLRAPLLILWGSRDKLVPRAVIDRLEGLVPASESYVHLGGGHHLQEDEPEWVAEKIDTFLRPTDV